MSQYLDPFMLLQEYEVHARQFAATLPREEIEQFVWTGVGFKCHGQKLIARLDAISEVVSLPAITHLPWVANWVRGMIHVRGDIMPIMDLSLFLGGQPARIKSDTRLIVVHQAGIKTGLLVESILGSQRVYKDTVVDRKPECSEAFAPFVGEALLTSGETWLVFNFKALFQSPQFFQING